MIHKLQNFGLLFHQAVQKGLLLFTATILAFIIANSHFSHNYHDFFEQIIGLTLNNSSFNMTIHHWVNEFLMAIFFLVVGMEIKREMIEGHLKDRQQRLLPIAAATAGVILPTLIYIFFNYKDNIAIQGWAIPAATDIAFALGVYALFAKNLPVQLRVFLTALAIIDDLIAVLIIALFYGGDLDITYITPIILCCTFLFLLNKSKISLITPYLVAGLFLWYFFLKSGLHATISGVLLGMFIPLNSVNNVSPLKELEKNLTIYVEYLVLPLFAFSNCGILLTNITLEVILHPIVLGIIFGLYFGKIIGISATVWALIKFRLIKLNKNVKFSHYFLVSIFCAIGFTMSLFISLIGFEDNQKYLDLAKIGIIIGSLIAMISAFIVKKVFLRK